MKTRWMVVVGMALVAGGMGSAWAQSAPLKASAKRISGAPSASSGNVTQEYKLHVTLQNMSNKPLEGVEVQWTFVVEDDNYSPTRRTFHDGEKTVDVKPLAKLEFDTDFVGTSRYKSAYSNYSYGQTLRGHWIKVTYQGKTILEDFIPQSVKKYIEQRAKDEKKSGASGTQ